MPCGAARPAGIDRVRLHDAAAAQGRLSDLPRADGAGGARSAP